jgi:hypothetical protein
LGLAAREHRPMGRWFVLLFADFDIAEPIGRLATFLFVFACALLSWFTGGYVAVAEVGGQNEHGVGTREA